MNKPSTHAIRAAEGMTADSLHEPVKSETVQRVAEHIETEAVAPAVAEAVKPLVEALESVASEQCCETPGCSEENPHCSTMLARAALAPYRQS